MQSLKKINAWARMKVPLFRTYSSSPNQAITLVGNKKVHMLMKRVELISLSGFMNRPKHHLMCQDSGVRSSALLGPSCYNVRISISTF